MGWLNSLENGAGMISASRTFSSKVFNEQVLSTVSKKTQNIAKRLLKYYRKESHTEEVLHDIQDFITVMNRDIRPNEDSIFNAILHAYTTKNNQYPEKFDTYIATQYFNKTHQKEEDLDRKSSEWLNQKIIEVEKHLERISLVKLQLTKHIKELESQGEGHLWIDHEFIEPVLDTLKDSLTQVQDVENRMLALKFTYEFHQG